MRILHTGLMKQIIPYSEKLTTLRFGRVFRNTVATYKYFWLISIMQIHAKRSGLRISVWEIIIRMVANAWYPIHYFRLSFGKSDSLFKIVMELQRLLDIPVDTKLESVVDILRSQMANYAVKSNLRILFQHVPYRFLRPWINTGDNQEMVERSQKFENNCLYSLHLESDGFFIELNSKWDDYLHDHYNIIMDFAYWNLAHFLQVRNPNVPSIPSKIVRAENRSSLKKQHDFWNIVIELGGPIHCIYTGRNILSDEYDLDHFMPWSFVSHDLLWNLVPSDKNINSSKNNKIPDMECYLPKMAEIQHHAVQTLVGAGKNLKLMEDYLTIGHTAKELADMDKEHFLEVMVSVYHPISQIALNMGFEQWNYESPM